MSTHIFGYPLKTSDVASTAQNAAAGSNKFTVPVGYYNGTLKVTATDAEVAALAADLLAANVKSTKTIFGVAGSA